MAISKKRLAPAKKVVTKKKEPAKKNPATIRPNPDKPVNVELTDVDEWNQNPSNAASLDEFLGSIVGKRFMGVLAWHSVISPRESIQVPALMGIEAHALMNSFRDGAAFALKTIQYMRKGRALPQEPEQTGDQPIEWGEESLSVMGDFQ